MSQNTYGKTGRPRLSREEEEKLFALKELIEKTASPDRPVSLRHPDCVSKSYSDLTDDEFRVVNAQDQIRRLLGFN
ncbi:MAG: hypothetical protein PHN75_09365 [Syntrophales bacterium]|nr:hypothetical protein [Syntrophales bacterium]